MKGVEFANRECDTMMLGQSEAGPKAKGFGVLFRTSFYRHHREEKQTTGQILARRSALRRVQDYLGFWPRMTAAWYRSNRRHAKVRSRP